MLSRTRNWSAGLAVAALAVFAAQGAAHAENTFYNCGGNGFTASVEISPEDGGAYITYPRGRFFARLGDGGAYLNDDVALQFYASDSPPRLFIGSEQFSCRIEGPPGGQTQAGGNTSGGATPYANLRGQSLGGKVRSGPGLNFGQSGSLREGDAITIIANTGVQFDGYDWFEIRYRGNRTGYQWGGIMCSDGQKVPGIFEQCGARSTQGASSLGAGRSYGGKVRSGPGTQHGQIGSLREGDPVEILSNAGSRFNGYDWFQIRYRGRTGYQWGGILCSFSAPPPGMFRQCE